MYNPLNINPYTTNSIVKINEIVPTKAKEVSGDVIAKNDIALTNRAFIAKNIIPNVVTFLYKKYIGPNKNANILNLEFDFA